MKNVTKNTAVVWKYVYNGKKQDNCKEKHDAIEDEKETLRIKWK